MAFGVRYFVRGRSRAGLYILRRRSVFCIRLLTLEDAIAIGGASVGINRKTADGE